MRLARYHYLIILAAAILSSCAQVGTISGGEVDHSAPRPITESVFPPNETTNFNGNKVEIPFDEFIRLNKPSENIVMVPPHAKIEATVKGKTLFLNWEEGQLQKNTTYAIYLNNAIKDITEGNDSLIQYVFSTGEKLDSLSYSTTIIDAWTNQPVNKCLVGLFRSETNELLSFGTTNKGGEVTLNYLPTGEFELLAFEDKNNDLAYQRFEKVAFPLSGHVLLQESIKDTVPLRMFSPIQKPIIRTVNYYPPGGLIVGANHNLSTAKVFIDGEENTSKQISQDSLLVFFNQTENNTLEIVIESGKVTDTSKVRLSEFQKKAAVSLQCKNSNNQFSPSEKILFYCNDLIKSVDKNFIEILNLDDSTLISEFNVYFSFNDIVLVLEEEINDFKVTFKEGAVTSTHAKVAEQSFKINVLLERQVGVIQLDISFYHSPIIIQLIKSGKIIREEFVKNPSEIIHLSNLLPGEYTFKIILDENENESWDVGDYSKRLQPEKIDYYSTFIKVRANWDIEVTLEK